LGRRASYSPIRHDNASGDEDCTEHEYQLGGCLASGQRFFCVAPHRVTPHRVTPHRVTPHHVIACDTSNLKMDGMRIKAMSDRTCAIVADRFPAAIAGIVIRYFWKRDYAYDLVEAVEAGLYEVCLRKTIAAETRFAITTALAHGYTDIVEMLSERVGANPLWLAINGDAVAVAELNTIPRWGDLGVALVYAQHYGKDCQHLFEAMRECFRTESPGGANIQWTAALEVACAHGWLEIAKKIPIGIPLGSSFEQACMHRHAHMMPHLSDRFIFDPEDVFEKFKAGVSVVCEEGWDDMTSAIEAVWPTAFSIVRAKGED
jgi:hypothetical protein